jgi:hypothetical protein
MNRIRYSTKMSKLTLAVRQEPEDYLLNRIELGWQPMKIYHELMRIAEDHKLHMISRRTLYSWLDKLNHAK